MCFAVRINPQYFRRRPPNMGRSYFEDDIDMGVYQEDYVQRLDLSVMQISDRYKVRDLHEESKDNSIQCYSQLKKMRRPKRVVHVFFDFRKPWHTDAKEFHDCSDVVKNKSEISQSKSYYCLLIRAGELFIHR